MKQTSKVLAICLVLAWNPLSSDELTDEQIRRILIEQSIRNYKGACACPYNKMRNGRRCGGNSAYSRPGGAQPLCFESDVTDEMVEQYRRRNPSRPDESA